MLAIITKAGGFAKKAYTLAKPYLPYVAMGAGTISVCAGAFLACKATLNLERVLDEHKAALEDSAALTEELLAKRPGCLTPAEIRADKFALYSVTAGRLFRMYGPAVGLIFGGFGCIYTAFGTVIRWHSMALNALSAIQAKFTNYRHNVIDEYGVDVDKRFAGEVVETTTLDVRVGEDDNGEDIVKPKEVVFHDITDNDFIDIYDYRNPTWEGEYLFSENFFASKTQWYTKLLQVRGVDHIWLNTAKKEFGFKESAVGHWYGWTSKPGCSFDITVIPCRRYTDVDNEFMPVSTEDHPFDIDISEDNPMLVPYEIEQTPSGGWVFANEADKQEFRELMMHDCRDVCWVIKWNVDCDEKGVPEEIYSKVYGGNRFLKSKSA